MNALAVSPRAKQTRTKLTEVADKPSAEHGVVADAGTASFGPLEWLVIAIGQRDRPFDVRTRTIVRAIGGLFARQPPNQLADTKLEELRRMAALAGQKGWCVPPSDMASFLRAGWSEDQLELLIERVAPPERRARVSPGQRRGSIPRA